MISPGNEAGPVGDQEERRIGDFLRPAQSLERNAADYLGPFLGAPLGAHFGLDSMRSDGIDCDPVRRQLSGQRLREGVYRPFGSAVCRGRSDITHLPRDRGYAQDPPKAHFYHTGNHSFAAIESAVHVDVEHVLPSLSRGVQDSASGDDAGLLTRISIGPRELDALLTMEVTATASVMSTWKERARTPPLRRLSSSSAESRTSTRTNEAPSAAKRVAIALPMPRAAPVTSVVRPSRSRRSAAGIAAVPGSSLFMAVRPF